MIRKRKQVINQSYLQEWDVRVLGFNVRCRICKQVYHKTQFKHLGYRVCHGCSCSYEKQVAETLTEKHREVSEFMKEHHITVKYPQEVKDIGDICKRM